MTGRLVGARVARGPDLDAVRTACYAALRAGQPAHALELADDAIALAKRDLGDRDPRVAGAHFLRSTVLIGIGDLNGAADACAAAAAIPSTDAATEKERLTYAWNQGQLLVQAGRRKDAVAVLERNVQERRGYYGEGHPGVAFGLDSLATAQLAAGDVDGALRAIDEAVAIDQAARHPKLVAHLVVREAVRKAGNATGNAADSIRDLPPELTDDALLAAEELATGRVPGGLDVLWDLTSDPTMRTRLSPQRRRAAKVLAANEARATGRQELVLGVTRLVIADASKGLDSELAADAHQVASTALDKLGRHEEAAHELDAAAKIAEATGDGALLATVRRNQAIRLNDLGSPDEARAAHVASVAAAERSGRRDLVGKALGAYGILLQHQGDEEAHAHLERAVALVPVDDSDRPYIESHARALARGELCGCPDGATIGDWLRDMAEQHVPAGLLESISIGENGAVDVRLTRKPTDTEAAALDRALRLATSTLRSTAKRG